MRRSALGFALFEIVRDAEPHAPGVVHLPRRLLGVLQLGETVFDLRQLRLDLALDVADLLARHLERVLVELALVGGKAHSIAPPDLGCRMVARNLKASRPPLPCATSVAVAARPKFKGFQLMPWLRKLM